MRNIGEHQGPAALNTSPFISRKRRVIYGETEEGRRERSPETRIYGVNAHFELPVREKTRDQSDVAVASRETCEQSPIPYSRKPTAYEERQLAHFAISREQGRSPCRAA